MTRVLFSPVSGSVFAAVAVAVSDLGAFDNEVELSSDLVVSEVVSDLGAFEDEVEFPSDLTVSEVVSDLGASEEDVELPSDFIQEVQGDLRFQSGEELEPIFL